MKEGIGLMVLALAVAGAIWVGEWRPGTVNILYTNAPACARVEASWDLTNWACEAELRRCDGKTNTIAAMAWSHAAHASNRYWRIVPCN